MAGRKIKNEESASQEEITTALAEFFINCEIPAEVIDSHYFKKFAEKMNPNYKLPGKSLLASYGVGRNTSRDGPKIFNITFN